MPPTPPSPDAPPSTTPTPAPPPRQQPPDIQPRRLSLTVIALMFVSIFVIVGVTALLGASDGFNRLAEQLGMEAQDIRDVIYGLINVVYFVAGIIALITLLLGAFRAATSLGNPREVQRGKRTLAISLTVLIALIGTYVLIYRMIQAPVSDTPPPAGVSIATDPAEPKGPVPFKVGFRIDSSYPEDATYTWSFGDGAITNSADVSHEYVTPGTYEVVLSVKIAEQEVETQRVTIQVTPEAPGAEVIAQPEAGPAPLTVAFDGSGSKPGFGAKEVRSFRWDFGDTAANEANPNTADGARVSHTYMRPGTYTAALTVEDDTGTSSTATVELVVQEAPEDPIARILTSPPLKDPTDPDDLPFIEVLAQSTVSFTGEKSTSPVGKIVGYAWDFHDGTQAVRGKSVDHTFRQVGEYAVELTVTDEEDRTATMQVLVRVVPQKRAPTAKIEGSGSGSDPKSAVVRVGELLTLSGAGSTDEDGNVVAYAWDLGDGSTASGERIEHAYTKVGTFYVKLTVTDNDDLPSSEVAVYTVKVNAAVSGSPTAVLRATPQSGPAPLKVRLDASGSSDPGGSIVGYRWRFGDGTPELQGVAIQEHTYLQAKEYRVEVIVMDNDGNESVGRTVVIPHAGALVAKIEVNKTVVPAGADVSFNGAGSLGSVRAWNWTFGDGTQAIGRSVTHAFAKSGFYDVMLTVESTDNQSHTATVRIEVQ